MHFKSVMKIMILTFYTL